MALIPKQINELVEAADPVDGESLLEIEIPDGAGGFVNRKIKKYKLVGNSGSGSVKALKIVSIG